MKYTVIAPLGDNIQALFVGLRDFPTEEVILLVPEKRIKAAEKVRRDLERFSIRVRILELGGNIWESVFQKIGELTEMLQGKNVLVNTATGDRSTTCAATSAAFVNGLKAVSVEGEESMLLPVLKFSYYKLLSDRKMKILKVIATDKTCCKSLDDLAKRTKMSLPLISYHVNGNLKSEGLKDLGLIETVERHGKTAVSLTLLGRMLMKGYVKSS